MPALTSLVSLQRLDNVFPPTWDGDNPELTSPYIDPETALRCSQGDDEYNYITDQRPEGDLFKRDLINGAGIRALSAFLATNNGINMVSPGIKVAHGKEVCVGTFPVNSGVSYVVTLAQLSNTSANFVLQVRDQTGTVQYTTNGAGTLGWGINAFLPSATSWSVVIMNTAGSGFLSGNVSVIITPYQS